MNANTQNQQLAQTSSMQTDKKRRIIIEFVGSNDSLSDTSLYTSSSGAEADATSSRCTDSEYLSDSSLEDSSITGPVKRRSSFPLTRTGLVRQNAVCMNRNFVDGGESLIKEKYDRVKHYWTAKKFYRTKISMFLAAIHEENIEETIQRVRGELARARVLDEEGLILSSVTRPFDTNKDILFSLASEPHLDLDLKDVIILRGVWLSKVCVGNRLDLHDWVADFKLYIKTVYGRVLKPRQELFTLEQSALKDQERSCQKAVVVLFAKITD